MKRLWKLGALILFSLILLFASFLPLPLTGRFVLIGVGLLTSLLCSMLSLLFIFSLLSKRKVRRTDELDREYWLKRLRGIKSRKEGDIVFDIGNMASYLKARGEAHRSLTSTGEARAYVEFWDALHVFLEEAADEIDSNYVLSLLSRIREPYISQALEKLAEIVEEPGIRRLGYLSKKELKRLRRELEKYVR